MSSGRHGLRRAGCLLILAVGVVAACRHAKPTHQPTIDLLRQFPYTRAGRNTHVIELGRPGANANLLHGWSLPEQLPTGESVIRGSQRRAALTFAVAEIVDRHLRV